MACAVENQNMLEHARTSNSVPEHAGTCWNRGTCWNIVEFQKNKNKHKNLIKIVLKNVKNLKSLIIFLSFVFVVTIARQ